MCGCALPGLYIVPLTMQTHSVVICVVDVGGSVVGVVCFVVVVVGFTVVEDNWVGDVDEVCLLVVARVVV